MDHIQLLQGNKGALEDFYVFCRFQCFNAKTDRGKKKANHSVTQKYNQVNVYNSTFTERFGAIPGAGLGADERGGPIGIHGETRGALERDRVVVGEITPKSHPVSWHSGIAAVDNWKNIKVLKNRFSLLPCCVWDIWQFDYLQWKEQTQTS